MCKLRPTLCRLLAKPAAEKMGQKIMCAGLHASCAPWVHGHAGRKACRRGALLASGVSGQTQKFAGTVRSQQAEVRPVPPPVQGACPPGGQARARGGGVFAHVASVAPLLHSSRAWPHVASRVLAHVAPDLFGLWHRISRHAPGHMALMCSALGHSGGRLRPAE
jgi:hypothetical protein